MTEVSTGTNPPHEVNVIIEIKKGERNKYEVDKATGRLTLDRVNATMLGYPADYGYIPGTLCVLRMIDDGENDEKLIVVPVHDVTKSHIVHVTDLGADFKKIVEHYYTHYKAWKKGWTGSHVSFDGWGDADEARQVIEESVERAQQLAHK